MDALTGLLDGPRARGAFLLRAILNPPWCLRVQDESPLALIAFQTAPGWVIPDDGEPVRMLTGDVVLVRGPEPYTVTDDPASPPQAVIHPGARCATPDGDDLHDFMDLGVRTWGPDPNGSTTLLVGTYQMQGEISRSLLDTLPHLLVLSRDDWDSPLLRLLSDEVVREAPGQDVVLDRLLDLVLIDGLRVWFSRPDSAAPAWYGAQGDPVVGPALRVMHDDAAHPWTVAELAGRAGVSRAAMARRFTALVGETPMAYLTGWRLTLAADLLREPNATLGAVARQVGYGSAFALSAAFKRVRGISPREHRRLGLAEPPERRQLNDAN